MKTNYRNLGVVELVHDSSDLEGAIQRAKGRFESDPLCTGLTPLVWVHPLTAKDLGLAEGGQVCGLVVKIDRNLPVGRVRLAPSFESEWAQAMAAFQTATMTF